MIKYQEYLQPLKIIPHLHNKIDIIACIFILIWLNTLGIITQILSHTSVKWVRASCYDVFKITASSTLEGRAKSTIIWSTTNIRFLFSIRILIIYLGVSWERIWLASCWLLHSESMKLSSCRGSDVEPAINCETLSQKFRRPEPLSLSHRYRASVVGL